MENFINILDIIIWPSTLLIALIFFRKEVQKAFSRLSNLKFKDFEANFGKHLSEIQSKKDGILVEKIETQNIESKEDLSKSQIDYDRLSRLSEISPRAAVSESWIYLESSAYDAAKNLELPIKGYLNIQNVIKAMIERQYFHKGAIKIFNELRYLRNEAAHSPEFALTQKEAEKYIQLSLELAQEFKSINIKALTK